jgi:tripartite-type tricarboxylate transporter receptor subunit TctC
MVRYPWRTLTNKESEEEKHMKINVMHSVSGRGKYLLALLAASAMALPVASAQAADNYPSRPVRIVTPAAPGGTTDFLARLLANHLTKAWNQQAIVDNRGSASGVNGAQIVQESAPDGYTLLIPYHQHTVNAALLPKLPYHPVNDFTPITQMTAGGLLLVVNPSHPAKTAKDFVQWAKTTKDPVNFGSAGIGSGGHLAGELFKLMTNTKAQHIPYKGTGPAAIALIQGEYQYNFMGLTGAFA